MKTSTDFQKKANRLKKKLHDLPSMRAAIKDLQKSHQAVCSNIADMKEKESSLIIAKRQAVEMKNFKVSKAAVKDRQNLISEIGKLNVARNDLESSIQKKTEELKVAERENSDTEFKILEAEYDMLICRANEQGCVIGEIYRRLFEAGYRYHTAARNRDPKFYETSVFHTNRMEGSFECIPVLSRVRHSNLTIAEKYFWHLRTHKQALAQGKIEIK